MLYNYGSSYCVSFKSRQVIHALSLENEIYMHVLAGYDFSKILSNYYALRYAGD